MNILFVNACVRGEKSRTLRLCHAALDGLKKRHPAATVTEIDLNAERPAPLYPETAEAREALRARGEFDHALFRYAREFAAADFILVGAPYWDLSFPALLKIFLEYVCAVDVTFAYPPEGGAPYGLCRAQQLLYVSTAGGPVGAKNFGFDYVKALCETFFGISATCFIADGLDMTDPATTAQTLAVAESGLRATIG